MAAYPLTDAYYLQQQQQQQQPPSAAPATVAQAKPGTTAMAAATSIYERQHQPPLQQPQPMLLQSLVLTTAADPNYGQQHQHSQQQQHPQGGTGAESRGCPSSSLRPAQVNILSSVGNVPLAPSHLLSHPNPPLHRPQPPQPERRKQLPEAPSSSSSADPSRIDAQVRMPSIVGGGYRWPSKMDCVPRSLEPVEMSASAAAGSASAAAAAFNRRPRKVAPPVVTQPNIPCQQPPVKTNSMTIVRGADDLNIIHLAKTNHRQYQGTTVDSSPISLYSSGAKPTVVANGWSSSSATDRNPPIADDQPLDLTSVKKKRQPEDLASDDSPLDLSIKKRRLDDEFVGDRQQKPVIDGHQGFSYIRPDTVVSSHEINARLAFQRSLVDQFGGQARVFNLQGGAVLIPPSISGVNTSSRGHRQVHNPPRPKAGHASPRSALYTTNPFPMFQGRTGTTEMSSAYSLNEVPVIRSAVAGFQLLSQSGSQSVVTSASVMSGISGSTNFGRNTTLCQDIGNHVALGQRPRSLLQQHQHQQQQHPQPSLSASCSTTPRDNIPNMLRTDQKMGPKDSCTGKGFNELPKYSDLNRASSAAAAPNALELGSHLQATPVIKSLQQQHQGSFSGSKQLAVGAIGCNDMNSKHTLNNLHDTLASVSTTPIPKTSYGVRPNSRGSHAKPRTPRPSVNSQTAPHDASTSSSFFAATSSSGAIVTDQRAHHVDHLRGIDQDLQLTTPKQETYLVGDVTAIAATPKVELTWKPESMPGKSEMSSQGEEESKRRVIQTMQAESPKKTLASGDVESVSAVLSRSYFQQGLASTENNRFTGISPEEMLKGNLVAKTEAICDDRKSEEADTMAKTSNTHNWLDSANGSRLSSSNIGALCSEAEKPVDPLNQSYVVRSDILEATGGAPARSAVQLNKRCEVVNKSETGLTNHTGDGLWAPNEQNVSSIQKLHQCTTKVPIVSADPPPPQESKDEALDKDSSRRVGVAGGCEACKWKESSDQAPPINNSFAKILSPCRNCDPREIPCDGGHTQAPMSFSGDLIPRQCTCRGFDRPAPRRIPVANVQPFMKEPADVAVVKSSADPVQPTLDDVQKPEDAQTDASTVVIDDANAKAAMTSGALKIDSQTVGWTSGDTPHLKEFVKFLEISAANPYRTPDEKLRETHGRGGSNEAADCTDRGRVKRQLLMPLAGSKNRSKPTGEAKREGGLVVGCDSKKTPVEYIDEDNCFDPVNGKEKATSEARDSMGRTSTTAENDDSLYGASALYQTMKALDRQQAEDRVKASQMLANSAAFSLSKTDFERKAPADEGATYGLNRASDRLTSDVTVEQRKKKKKQKPKVTNLREATEQLETQRLDDTKSNNIGEQLTKDAHTELASSVASATDEAAASEAAGNSYVAASTSALDEKSVSKSAMKRKYQRKKTKPEELPPRADDGHQVATELTGSKSSPITSMSSSESTEVTPKKKRRRAIELLTQFNPRDEARDLDENRLSRSVTDQLNASTTHSSSSILLQVPQFLQQTPAVGSSTGRRRGTSARRAGSIVRHARRSSNYDRNAAYEAELKQEAERRLVRRGHGRGCRAAARHQQRMLSLHRLTDAEPRSDTPNAPYVADDATDHYHRQLQQQPQSQKVDDETTRDLFEYDDSSDAVFPIRGRGQGRKPVRKNGRIAFQYPEVFGRRRARGGLRGRSRPVRGSDGAVTDAVGWGGFDPSDLKDFEMDRTHNEEVLNDDQGDSFSAQSISEQVPSAAATTSIRGKVRSRVRVGGRGSRGHPRSTHSAPRYDPVPPAATDNRPCPSSALGRDASETRLHQVTRLGYEELVSYYLTTGIIHPNVQDNSGVTPLHDSCSHGYLNITRLLLDHGAHPNSKALDGTRPLHLAVANDHVEIVRLLLSYGADITMTNVTGRSPLQMAKTRDMKQLLKGFSSDLSGGKGKEIPWQFPALFEVGGCDVLADAPADDQIEATEVLFDLGTDNSLPVHRFVSDSQKGPRNFHSVSDLCKDVKVDDFLLLNGDLTYVHVTSAADLPSSTEVASSDVLGHPMPGPSSSSSSSTSLSSLSSSSSLDHQLSTPSVGASTSSASIVSHHHHQQLQQQQHRGWIPLSSSRQRTHCSSVTGVDRSSYVEIDVSLKGLLDIGVHRVPLLAHRDVPCPSRDPFSSRPKRSGDSKDLPRSASGNASLVPSGGSDFSSVSPSSSFASATVHTSKSELANPDDVIASAPSSVEKLTTICETITGNGQSEQSAMRLDSKKKIPNCLTASPGPPSSVPTPRATPLPHSDQKLESGNSRDNSLEQCRIVLCDIKSPSSSSTDLNSIKCDARKDVDKSTTVIQNRAAEEERKKAERKQTVQTDELTVTANASPVRLTSLTHRTTGHVAKASTDLIVPLHNVPASQRPGLGSSERGIANGSSSSGIAAAAVTQRRLAVFGNARRRVVARELVDGVMASKPEASHSESLIPVLEKHGSDDETPPVENEEDVCGESYDDEREMPQLTLYA